MLMRFFPIKTSGLSMISTVLKDPEDEPINMRMNLANMIMAGVLKVCR